MGNNIIEKINPELEQIKASILEEDYQASFNKYSKINEYLKKNVSIDKQDIEYLLLSLKDFKNRLKFQTIIGNLKKEHKLLFLFQLVFDQYLIDSIEKIEQKEINKNKSNDKANNKEEEKQEIKKKIIIKKISNMENLLDWFILNLYYMKKWPKTIIS